MELKRVVVTGLGAVTPLGKSVAETWANLLEGKSGCAPITLFDASKFKTQFACEVKDFDPLLYFEKKEVRKVDRYTQFAFAAASEAIKDCGIDLETEDKNRIGVIYSSGIGGIKTFHEETMGYDPEVGPRYNPFFIPKMISDIAAGQLSIHYGFHGPNYGTVSACASSTHGMIDAFNLLRLGKANIMVVGGAEAAVAEPGVGGFNAMKALSTRNDDPEHASRPFSASRDGFVIGEGSGCLILEELEHAKARGARIYAEVVGGGMSADAYHLTSTPVGDRSEAKAIQQVFGDWAYKLNISSTKSMTGHLLGAAGAVEALICVKAVECDIVPPTINHEEEDKDPEIDYNLNFTFNKAQKRQVRAALSNTFGFGGHNGSIIVKKYEE